MPGVQFPEGGAIYRAYKARWEAEAKKTAQEAANACNVQYLFNTPAILQTIAVDGSEEFESAQSSYDFIIALTEFIEEKENDFKSGYTFEQVGTEAYR
jgi:hypothetical protein